jgi:hypothetical protein
MKKYLLGGAAILAIAAVAAVNVSLGTKSDDLSNVFLANVEALAGNELSDCPNGCYDNGNGCYCNGWHPCEREA